MAPKGGGARGWLAWAARPLTIGLAAIGALALPCIAYVVLEKGWQAPRYQRSEFAVMANGLLLEAFRQVEGRYPSPGFNGKLVDIPEAARMRELSDSLRARRPWSTSDGWGHPMQYACSSDGMHYSIVSPGANGYLGQFQSAHYLSGVVYPAHWNRANETYDEDIVMTDGTLAQWLGGWCCNPEYREFPPDEIQYRIRRGILGGCPCRP